MHIYERTKTHTERMHRHWCSSAMCYEVHDSRGRNVRTHLDVHLEFPSAVTISLSSFHHPHSIIFYNSSSVNLVLFLSLSLSLSLSFYFNLSLCLSISIYLSVFLFQSISLKLFFSLYLSLSFSLSLSLSLCLSISIYLSVFILQSISLSFYFNLSLCLYTSIYLSVFILQSISLSLYFNLSLWICFSVSIALSFSVTLFNNSYGSDDGKGAAWHPTRGFHLLRGEAISWIYTLVLLDAIFMIQDEQETKSIEELKKGDEKICICFFKYSL